MAYSLGTALLMILGKAGVVNRTLVHEFDNEVAYKVSFNGQDWILTIRRG